MRNMHLLLGNHDHYFIVASFLVRRITGHFLQMHSLINSPSSDTMLYCTMTSAPSPLFPRALSSTSCKPSGMMRGISLFASLAFVSAHWRRRTKLLMRASPRAPMLVRMASLTLLATSRRRDGSRSSASSFCSFPVAGRKINSVMVSSRSFKKSGLVAARGASCEEAKLKAGVTSDVADDVHDRINSMSCSRSRAK